MPCAFRPEGMSLGGMLYPFIEQAALYDFLVGHGLGNNLTTAWWKGGTTAAVIGNHKVSMNEEMRRAFGSVAIMKCPARRGSVAYVPGNLAAETYSRQGPQTDYAFVIAIRNDTSFKSNDFPQSWLTITGEMVTANGGSSQPAVNGPAMHAGPFRLTLRGTDDSYTLTPRDTFARITDGLSNQFFVGEKHIPEGLLGNCFGTNNSDRAHDCSYLTAFTNNTGAMGRAFHRLCGLPREWVALARGPQDRNDASPETVRAGFGSWHPGIALFLMGDGAVRPFMVTTPVETILFPLSHVDDGANVTLN